MIICIPHDQPVTFSTRSEVQETPFGDILVPVNEVSWAGRVYRLGVLCDPKTGTMPAMDMATGKRVQLLYEETAGSTR